MNDLRSRMECEVPEMPQIERDETPMWNPATETIDEFMARAQRFVDGETEA